MTEPLMDHPRPRVSVIIPVYNCRLYLGEAIASALGQTRPPDEVIVVDDGSTDGSDEVTRAIAAQTAVPVRYVSQPHAGIGAARNHGVSLATGSLIAFLDADDLWAPRKLELQAAALAAGALVDMAFGHMEQFISPDLDEAARASVTVPAAGGPAYMAASMLIRRAALDRAGSFCTRWHLGEFVDWYLRAAEAGLRSLMLPDVLLHRRIHADNVGRRERGHKNDYVRILKASLDRRRAARETS